VRDAGFGDIAWYSTARGARRGPVRECGRDAPANVRSAPQGDGEKRLDLLARLATLRKNVGGALAIAKAANVQARVPHRCGMPLCVTPREFYVHNMSYYAASGDNVEAGKRRGDKCGTCAFQDRCVGVWKHYLDQFGDGELEPIPASELPAPVASALPMVEARPSL
jgi:hypothetical protein